MHLLGCRFTLVVSLACAVAVPASERRAAGAAEIKHALDRLNVLGSVLMIAAHPDDENTALLAWCARHRKLRTAYLSLTRGEGGQNLIGPEQGDLMGVIRTQELLAARRIDGADQYFTRAIDFGFSKSAEETLARWGREPVLADVVWTVRRFQPDVIVLRFSGTPRDGHGHHQSSAILGREAFTAAADPNRFPEQLRSVKPWQARRLLYNVFAFNPQQEREAAKAGDRIEIDTGEFDPALGYSYGEIAAMSRGMHRSQGMGSAGRRGSMKNSLVHVAGEPAKADMFDGIDTTWRRVEGGEAVAAALEEASRRFTIDRPHQAVPALLEARGRISRLDDPLAARKRTEIDEAIALCVGLWLDANAARWAATPGSSLAVRITALNRSPHPVTLAGVRLEGIRAAATDGPEAPLEYNTPREQTIDVRVPDTQPGSQPYWLRNPHSGFLYSAEDRELAGEDRPLLRAIFAIRVGGQIIDLERPVTHRWVDRVRGELARPLEVVPAVAVELGRTAVMFPHASPARLEVELRANSKNVSGRVRLETPAGWMADPASQPFQLTGEGQRLAVGFTITPPAGEARGEARGVAVVDGREISTGMRVIQYDHIPPQTLFPPARAALVRSDIRTRVRNTGYVMGAGDDVPEALAQLGIPVTLLDSAELARGDLARFDAIVIGVRAYNVRDDLRASQHRLLEYVERGGTLVVQYNVLEGGFLGGDPARLARIGPYPLRIGRERVTDERAPVRFPAPDHPLLAAPNRITPGDFDGWTQERGLYFAAEWDARYQPLFECADPGEKPLGGGTLYAAVGQGHYIFTAYSWFRQLPTGAPGAFRVFANFLSAGKR